MNIDELQNAIQDEINKMKKEILSKLESISIKQKDLDNKLNQVLDHLEESSGNS